MKEHNEEMTVDSGSLEQDAVHGTTLRSDEIYTAEERVPVARDEKSVADDADGYKFLKPTKKRHSNMEAESSPDLQSDDLSEELVFSAKESSDGTHHHHHHHHHHRHRRRRMKKWKKVLLIVVSSLLALVIALGGVFHESVVACLVAERLAVVAVGCELDVLLGVTDGDLCKVGATSFETFAQVVSAGSLQSLLEDLVAERVVNLYLDRRCAALGVREYAVVDTDIADGVLVCRVDAHVFVFVDGELTFVIGLCGLAFLEQAYIDVLEGLALVVGDFSANRVGE